MKTKIILWICAMLLLVNLANAELIYKQGEDIDLKVNCFDTANNLCSGDCQISVLYPNGSTFIDAGKMSLSGIFFNYTLPIINTTGNYKAVANCSDSLTAGYTNFDFTINYGGLTEPDGITKVIFIIIFLIIFAWVIYSTINLIEHFLRLDVDIKDLIFIWIGYFIMFAFYSFSLDYFGNKMVIDFLRMFLEVGMYTQIILPAIAFVISFIAFQVRRKKDNG